MTHKDKIDKIDAIINGEGKFPTVKKVLWLLKQENITLNAKQLDYLNNVVLWKLQEEMATTKIAATAAIYNRYLKKHYPDEWDEENNVSDTAFKVEIDFKNDSENKI